MPDTRTAEDGFSLVELVVCVAIIVMGCVVALAVVPSLYRGSESGLLRAAATTIARNEIERAQAAAAYYPPGSVLDPANRAAATANHAWALAPSDGYQAVARLRRSLCANGHATTDVPMTVATTYAAASDTLTVTVTYPHTACAAATPADRVVLVAQLAPAAYAPQTVLQAPIRDPADQ